MVSCGFVYGFAISVWTFHDFKTISIISQGFSHSAFTHARLRKWTANLSAWGLAGETFATVYGDSDAEWLAFDAIGSWDAITNRLYQWESCCSDIHGCIDISNPTSAAPTLALTDENIPLYCVLHALTEFGWTRVSERRVHSRDTLALKQFDGRGSISRKSY